jgi:hypothetical protein
MHAQHNVVYIVAALSQDAMEKGKTFWEIPKIEGGLG